MLLDEIIFLIYNTTGRNHTYFFAKLSVFFNALHIPTSGFELFNLTHKSRDLHVSTFSIFSRSSRMLPVILTQLTLLSKLQSESE